MPIWNERIHEKRIEKGITLAQIADRLGVTEATAQRYERGNIKSIPYEHMCTYGEILNCSPAYLMGWDEEDPTIQNRDADLEAIEKILSADGYTLCCESYDDDYFIVKITVQAVSKHEAIRKILEIVPTATYKKIIEIKEDT